MTKRRAQFILFGLTALLLAVFLPNPAEAARLYLTSAQAQYQPGDTFNLEIHLDPEGECLNAVAVKISYPADVLLATDTSTGQSLLSLWVRPPKIDKIQGLISFAGGVPGGYCGRIPGDPGESNLLARIIFKIPGNIIGAPKDLAAEIKFLPDSQALLNDGLGTPAKLTTAGKTIAIISAPEIPPPLPQPEVIPAPTWEEELAADKIPPEPFAINLYQENGRYFIAFFTIDKQTGLDHYEVQEGIGDWLSAQSPYLLTDQKLQSVISVKAVDKAGNIRLARYLPPPPVVSGYPFYLWLVIALLAVSLYLLIWLLVKRSNRKRK